MCRHLPPRRGLTLIELMVVVFILGVLFALGVYFYPSYSAKQKMVTATDRITGMLLMAKQRAKRDGLVTGLRITTTGSVTELTYIQQPDTPSAGRASRLQPNGPPGSPTSNLLINASLNPSGVGPLIEPGDYIELNGGGRLHQVLAVLIPTAGNTPVVIDHSMATTETYTAQAGGENLSNYRVFAQARPLTGEQVVELPNAVVASTTLSVPAFDAAPNRLDVLFSPAGNVVVQTNTHGQVFIVVEDVDPANATVGAAPRFIVAVRLRTGAIGVYPYNEAGPDPYSFAKDGRSSGL